MSQSLLQQGIDAFRSNEKDKAFILFSDAVKKSPNSAMAWFWLGKTVDDPERKKYCFDRALQIDPDLRSKLHSTKSNSTISQPVNSENSDSESVQPAKKMSRRKFYLIGLLGVGLLMAIITLGVIGMDKGWRNQPNLALPLQHKEIVNVAVTKTPPATSVPSTLTPLPSITHLPTRTNTPEPSATMTTDPTRVYESLGFQVTAARLALDKHQNEECIQYYDRLLEAMPNWTSGYYNRGVCKDGSALKMHDLDTYKDTIADALVDVDIAIALGPVKGKYFAERGYIYRNIQEVLENSTSEQAALNIAIENIQTGINLGDEPNLQADLPSFLHESGQCQESVDLAKKLLETGSYDLNIKTILYDSIATGYLCLGDYSSAKPVIEKRIQLSADCDAYLLQTSILIGLGEQDQAFKVIDRCITDSPNYGGYRYYLRSLIQWDRGEKDLARQDLQAGAGNTWSHGGLCAYVAGLVALDDGDQVSGKELLKYAESTFKMREGLWVKERIRSSLASLNIPEQDPTPVVTFNVTPIVFQQLTPAAPATQSPDPVIPPTDVPEQIESPDETSPVPAGYEDAILVDFNVGTGPLVLAAGDYPLFHFRPSLPLAVSLAKEIHFYLSPEGKVPSPVQVYLWTKDGGWRMMKPHWGDNLVDHPSSYISPTGDTYIAIRNYSTNTTVRIDNVSLLVTAELTNSDLKTYGKGK